MARKHHYNTARIFAHTFRVKCISRAILFLVASTSFAQSNTDQIGYGGGLFVSAQGDLLTAAHVVWQCPNIQVPGWGTATIHDIDRRLDVAWLKLKTDRNTPFAVAGYSQKGESVSISRLEAAGTPYQRTKPLVTVVSANSGDYLKGHFHIPVRLRQGQSGAPVFDAYGKWTGLLIGKLTPSAAYELTGSIHEPVGLVLSSQRIKNVFADMRWPDQASPEVFDQAQVDIRCHW